MAGVSQVVRGVHDLACCTCGCGDSLPSFLGMGGQTNSRELHAEDRINGDGIWNQW